jgi:DNA primase
LFSASKSKDEKTILITEGELDCLVAWSHNIPAVTSTGGAQSFQEGWTNYFNGKEVILCFDNDQAGADGMVRILDFLPDAKVMFIPDRPNMKDITDYVASGGDLQTLIKSAKHFATISDVKEDMLSRIATFQSVYFHNAYIKAHTKSNVKYERKAFSNDSVTNAKLYPIPNLIEFKQNKAPCPFHNEKTPSFTYFPKTNTCYCFGCSKVADSIEIYKKQHGCSFTEAVAKLNELV